MKNIIYISLLLLLTTGCSKSFLERQPIDRRTIESFFQTPEDAFQSLVAAYSVLNWNGYGHIILSSEIASDNCFGGGGLSDNGPRQWDKFQYLNDHNADAWQKYYTGIYRTNVFLKYIDGIDFGANEALKNTYKGEALFLRAYFYYDLVRMFGKVPLLSEPIEGNDYYIPQADPAAVYALIGNDLKQAIQLLKPGAKTYAQIPPGEYGRATVWSAEALLARVYLFYTGYFQTADLAGVANKQEVIDGLKDIIDNSGYDLVTNYGDLWRANNESTFAGQNNKEGVFVIQFTDRGLGDWDQQNGNRLQVMVGIRNQSLENYYRGWGIGTVNPKLYQAFEADDTRRNASIISIDDESLPINLDDFDQYQYTGYYWKKYTPVGGPTRPDANGGDFQIDNYDNIAEIRFADVLLMAAELLLETDLGTAQTYYDRVRLRAFAGNTSKLKVLTPDAAGKNLILQERRLELALEGHRYWDLLRQGLAVAKSAIDDATPGDFNTVFRPETQGWFSIPQTQITLSNGSLVQNPGWN